MTPEFIRHLTHDYAQAIRANPLATRDVQELIHAMNLTQADLVAAQVSDSDLKLLPHLAWPGRAAA